MKPPVLLSWGLGLPLPRKPLSFCDLRRGHLRRDAFSNNGSLLALLAARISDCQVDPHMTLYVILGNAVPSLVKISQMALGVRIALVSSLAEPFGGFGRIFRKPPSGRA